MLTDNFPNYKLPPIGTWVKIPRFNQPLQSQQLGRVRESRIELRVENKKMYEKLEMAWKLLRFNKNATSILQFETKIVQEKKV